MSLTRTTASSGPHSLQPFALLLTLQDSLLLRTLRWPPSPPEESLDPFWRPSGPCRAGQAPSSLISGHTPASSLAESPNSQPSESQSHHLAPPC